MMKFYRENKVNPFASCLPMVAQFPVFISLYYMLRIDLRHDICPEINGRARRTTRPDALRVDGERRVPLHPDLTDKATGSDADHPDRPLRRLAAVLDAADVDDDGPHAAHDLPGAAVPLRHLRDPVPGRPARVLDHHEHVDDRAAGDHPQAPRPAASAGADTGGVASGGLFGGWRWRRRRRAAPPTARSGGDGDSGGKAPARVKEPAKVGGAEPKGRPASRPPAPPRKKKKRSGRRR